jgi:receptor protein-tyrosine kinase
MSTIEKAFDRMAKKGPPPKVHAEDGFEQQLVADSREPVSSEPSPVASAPGADFASAEPRGGIDERVREPDLEIQKLNNELLLSPAGGRSRTAEEFRMIKRPLLTNAFDRRARAEKHPNLIMVTSSVQGEGKTFTSLNLAVSITMELDSTVLLIDADVAKPGLSRTLSISDKPGLIERLADETKDLDQMLLRTDIPKLTVLPAGQKHKRSTELLASGAMRRLLEEVATRYDDRIILFDSPPLLETSEAGVVASQMGQVVVVVEHESTSQVIVKEALSQFENTDNVYLLLNKCKENIFSGKYGYGYGYGYGYSYGSYGEK